MIGRAIAHAPLETTTGGLRSIVMVLYQYNNVTQRYTLRIPIGSQWVCPVVSLVDVPIDHMHPLRVSVGVYRIDTLPKRAVRELHESLRVSLSMRIQVDLQCNH